jgi:hypothetical protein
VKFNLEKIEIILIGREEHWHFAASTRKLSSQDWTPLSKGTWIAKDSEAVRMLGAWIENRIKDITLWELIIDKISIKLEC